VRVERPPFAGRRVLLGVTGGIAAYKAVSLARELTLAGAAVDVVLTSGALEFVASLSFEALTGRPAFTELYTPGDPLLHIRLAREADLVLVAPATANFIARAAAGLGDDLLACILLATSAPVILCPAMNDRMYAHPLTQTNLERLRGVGYGVAGPAEGLLAWGEGSGPGRMLEPNEILEHAARGLAGRTALEGRRLLVTAGPTREPIDPVRFIGNRSSGRMGYALAAAAWRMGAEVDLISGPTSLPAPVGVRRTRVETAAEMREAVERALPEADVLVMAAAVADFRPAEPRSGKIKKDEGPTTNLALEPTADVLKSTIHLRRAGAVVVGFALETDAPIQNGLKKLEEKQLDLLVVNDAREPGAGFEVPTNRVTLLDAGGGREDLPLLPKDEVAGRILERVTLLLDRERG
jgi:phosphopantothenoylcysteine decarboxylase / phosphopantothenate---cysteine ligase